MTLWVSAFHGAKIVGHKSGLRVVGEEVEHRKTCMLTTVLAAEHCVCKLEGFHLSIKITTKTLLRPWWLDGGLDKWIISCHSAALGGR